MERKACTRVNPGDSGKEGFSTSAQGCLRQNVCLYTSALHATGALRSCRAIRSSALLLPVTVEVGGVYVFGNLKLKLGRGK
eukprot:6175913-Pleurochrysis_carterae.AAC.4